MRHADKVPHGAWVTASLSLMLAACERGQAPGDDGPLTIPRSDVHVLASSESIGEVRDLEVLPDGSIWLLNSVEPLFMGFDAEGRVIGRHGQSGGGPEELRMPAGLVSGGLMGEAWVFDYVRHTFIRISDPEAPWSQLPIPRDQIPAGSVRGGMDMMTPMVRTARLGEELVFPWTTGTMDSGLIAYRMALLGADLAALDPETGAVRHVLALGDVLEDPSADFVATDGGFPLWYRLWTVCGDHLRVYDRARNELRGFTASGEEIASISLPPAALTEATPLEFARAVFPLRQAEVTGTVGRRLTAEDSIRLLNEMAAALNGAPHELAAYLPRYVDLRCSEDGTMWLQPIDLDIGGLEGGPAWLRITSEGAIREIRLPPRFDALRFTPERIWGVQRDELDVASVAWIELPAGPPPPRRGRRSAPGL